VHIAPPNLVMDYDPAVVQITSHMEGDPPSQVYDVELGPFLGSTGRTTAPLGSTVDLCRDREPG